MNPRVFEFSKDPSEKFDIEVSFVNTDPAITYEVASVEVKAYDSGGVDVTADIVDGALTGVSQNRATVWVMGGIDGKTYKIEALATMVDGQKLMKRMLMQVKS